MYSVDQVSIDVSGTFPVASFGIDGCRIAVQGDFAFPVIFLDDRRGNSVPVVSWSLNDKGGSILGQETFTINIVTEKI